MSTHAAATAAKLLERLIRRLVPAAHDNQALFEYCISILGSVLGSSSAASTSAELIADRVEAGLLGAPAHGTFERWLDLRASFFADASFVRKRYVVAAHVREEGVVTPPVRMVVCLNPPRACST
jgi:hypothetical protein